MRASNIVGYEVVDPPSDKQLLAFAHDFYGRRQAMVGIATGPGAARHRG